MNPFLTIRLVAAREIRQRLRSRLFVGTTLALSAVLTLLALAPAVVGATVSSSSDTTADAGELVRVAVAGPLGSAERQALAAAVGGRLEVIAAVDERAAASLVERGDAALAVVDGDRVLEPHPAGVFRVGPDHPAAVADALALARLLDAAGLGPDEVGAAVELDPLQIEVVGDFDPEAQLGQLVLANVGVVLLFAVLTLYTTLIVNGIIEEKGGRVVELLIETMPVRQLMVGKLLGLGLVGLGQTVVLFAPALMAIAVLGTVPLPAGGAGALGLVVGWFLLGYAFYSVVAAGLGALVSRPEEAQAVLTPASLLMVTGYLVGFASINAPDGLFAVVTSWLPPTAPYVMLVRQLLGTPSTVEIAGAVVGTMAATALLALVAARVYEGGILRTGARVRVRDAWRSAR